MSLIFYPLIIVLAIVIVFIFGKREHNKASEDLPLVKSEPLIVKRITAVATSKFKWSVLVKSYKGIDLDFEENDLGKTGYYIFSTYKTQLAQHQIIVYIKNNLDSKYLKIVNDSSSESMIGVDYPIHGHIGYLSYIEVDKI